MSMPNITVNKRNKDLTEVQIHYDGSKWPVCISVYHNEPSCMSYDRQPEVNWPCLGSSSPEDARAFGLALIRAADIAEDLAIERAKKEAKSED